MDKRWEKVEAHFGDPYNYRYEIDYDWPRKGEWLEVEFCVPYKGQQFLSRHWFAAEDKETMVDWNGVVRMVMNLMVENIDKSIDYWERTGEHLGW